MCFFKRRGLVSNQTCSQSAVRGVSTQDARRERLRAHERTSAEPSDDRKIETADKKQKDVCGTKDDATNQPFQIILNLCHFVMNRTRQHFSVGGLSCRGAASSVDSITD